ncbi:MAG: hypothetical protein IJ144_04325, partial [Prevotella sp.]|nr:hypothetical protein [Prevotella sp.]
IIHCSKSYCIKLGILSANLTNKMQKERISMSFIAIFNNEAWLKRVLAMASGKAESDLDT